jgi:hypothetical protein
LDKLVISETLTEASDGVKLSQSIVIGGRDGTILHEMLVMELNSHTIVSHIKKNAVLRNEYCILQFEIIEKL